MRFSRAKPTGSFRVFHAATHGGRGRVAAHAETLAEARKDADYWTKTTSNPIEIQERFPSGAWVTIETKRHVLTRAGTASTRQKPQKTSTKKTAHATKAKTGATDKISIDSLAAMLDLPDWDKIDDMNQTHYWEMAQGAEDESEAESAAAAEVYNQWYDAVESTAGKLFEHHGLELTPTGKQGTEKRRYEF